MKIRTTELKDKALDCAVAIAFGGANLRYDTVATWWITIDGKDRALSNGWAQSFCPSTNWQHGGEIIDREIDSLRKRSKAEELSLAYPNPNFKFKAEIFTDNDYFCGFGSTPLIAAMRCYVTSKLGDIVDIPEELI